LELTVAQLQAEMSVKQREGELLQTDLDAERDRLASVKALLEVKVRGQPGEGQGKGDSRTTASGWQREQEGREVPGGKWET
jgi:hypothetical protein